MKNINKIGKNEKWVPIYQNGSELINIKIWNKNYVLKRFWYTNIR